MIHARFKDRYARKWYRQGSCYAIGQLFLHGELLEAENLASLITSENFRNNWPGSLGDANGFFSIVYQENGCLWAAVDRLRSYPLFYGQKAGDFYISDDARWVREQVGDEEMDELTSTEFLLTSYVTGRDTLYPNVKQLQAAESLFLEEKPEGPEIKRDRYYRYLHHDYFEESEADLMERMDELHLGVFKRLIKSADGKTFVIPLSGGYNSRLIAIMLKQLGYDKVICYTYGRTKGNREADMSKIIAEGLGLRWLFVPYTEAKWLQWYNSPQCQEHRRFADGLCTLPHLVDWPAVWDMKRQKLLPDNSVFLPGFSADLLAGGHVPSRFFRHKAMEADALVRELKKRHYKGQELPDYRHDLWSALEARIVAPIKDLPNETIDDAVSAFECWDWQERQGKRICPAVRVYEFWGYEWRMPEWDVEMTSFWERVPLRLRKGRNLWDTYMHKLSSTYNLNLPGRSQGKAAHLFIRYARRLLTVLGRDDFARRIYRQRQRTNHPLAYYGMLPRQALRERSEIIEFISFQTRQHLGRL